MNTNPNPKKTTAAMPPPSRQSLLPLESAEVGKRIPEERKSECIALLRELIEAVASPKRHAGGPND
jgi:hypothetical protein